MKLHDILCKIGFHGEEYTYYCMDGHPNCIVHECKNCRNKVHKHYKIKGGTVKWAY